MKNTTKHVNTLEVMSSFNMLEKFESLVTDGMTQDEALETVNSMVRASATAKITTVNGIKWAQLVDGVLYEQLTLDGETTSKMLRVSDLFILKANSKSTKTVIKSDLFVMLESFGVNLLDAEIDSLDDDTLFKLKVYTKHQPAFECFTCDTCTSNNMLEAQLQEFFNYFYGVDSAPKALKTYVKHLKKMYIKASKEGYKNGNALALLQLIINHAYDCKYGIKYEVKSALASHKAPKNDK